MEKQALSEEETEMHDLKSNEGCDAVQLHRELPTLQ
jgi:hypothetical protein